MPRRSRHQLASASGPRSSDAERASAARFELAFDARSATACSAVTVLVSSVSATTSSKRRTPLAQAGSRTLRRCCHRLAPVGSTPSRPSHETGQRRRGLRAERGRWASRVDVLEVVEDGNRAELLRRDARYRNRVRRSSLPASLPSVFVLDSRSMWGAATTSGWGTCRWARASARRREVPEPVERRLVLVHRAASSAIDRGAQPRPEPDDQDE